jgi:hypothetical protein
MIWLSLQFALFRWCCLCRMSLKQSTSYCYVVWSSARSSMLIQSKHSRTESKHHCHCPLNALGPLFACFGCRLNSGWNRLFEASNYSTIYSPKRHLSSYLPLYRSILPQQPTTLPLATTLKDLSSLCVPPASRARILRLFGSSSTSPWLYLGFLASYPPISNYEQKIKPTPNHVFHPITLNFHL